MPKITIKYHIYSCRRNDDGRYPIVITVYFRNRNNTFNSGYYAFEEELRGKPSDSTRAIKDPFLRRKIENLVREFEDAARDINSEMFINVNEVTTALKNLVFRKNFGIPFVAFSRGFIAEKEKSSHQAALNYKAAIASICEFFQKEEFDISLITSSSMRLFESWLRGKYPGKNGKDSRAVSLYTGAIRTIHNAARLHYNAEEAGDIFIKNVFDYYKPPKQPSAAHRDVEKNIIQSMIDNYPSLVGQERIAIGSFLLSFGTMGTNAPDLFNATLENGIIHYFRTKTRSRRDDSAEMYIQIPSVIKPLYQEYSDKTKRRAFNFYIRYASVKNLQHAQRDGMQNYMERIHYSGQITYYSARHSWATLARSKACGIPMSIIDDCLCHVGSYKIGDIYAKKDYSVLWEANEKVLSLFNWTNLTKYDNK